MLCHFKVRRKKFRIYRCHPVYQVILSLCEPSCVGSELDSCLEEDDMVAADLDMHQLILSSHNQKSVCNMYPCHAFSDVLSGMISLVLVII